ncbi:MAG: hypothetical protein V3573_06720 [Desulfovibrionaceae bacterium]
MVELPFEYTLTHPVKAKDGSVLLDKITITRPMRAKDLRHIQGSPTFGDLLTALASLAGEPPRIVDELHIEDAVHLAGVIADFFPAGLATGKQPPESLQ